MGLLRLFLALSVLLGHIGVTWGVSPMYAVQGFYIVSGFYMSMILNEKYCTSKENVLFLKKRFIRIVPLYWIIAFIALFISIWYYWDDKSNILFFDFEHFPSNASIYTKLFIIITNLTVLGQDASLFFAISPETGNLFFSSLAYGEEYPLIRFMLIPVAWSLSTEFLFYIIAPFILRKKYILVCFIFLFSIISNIITNFYGLNSGNWRFRFFPSTLVFFLTGYYSYLLSKKIPQRILLLSSRFKYLIVFSIIIILTFFMTTNLPYAAKIIFLLFVGLFSVSLLFCLFRYDSIDRVFGELSYPLYLIHPLFIGFNELLNINNYIFVIIGSLIGSYCCFIFIITPLEKYRSNIV